MKNPFETKAIFAWKNYRICDGDAQKTAEWLIAHGFEAVYVKVADGDAVYTPLNPATNRTQVNTTAEYIATLKANGLRVLGWIYNYGTNPAGEALLMSALVRDLGLDGVVWDIEAEYDHYNDRVARLTKTLDIFNNAHPDLPQAYCGWARYWSAVGAEWHKADVARLAMQYCDYGMPMTYWNGSSVSSALNLLNTTLEQWKKITDKPIIPAGRAYNGNGGTATAQAVVAFTQAALKTCPGISWWALDYAVSSVYLPIADALRIANNAPIIPPPPVDPNGKRVFVSRAAALNLRIAPGFTNTRRVALAAGDTLNVVGEPVTADGVVWVPVQMYVALEDVGKDITYGELRSKIV